jgi:serine/threonine protein kinase
VFLTLYPCSVSSVRGQWKEGAIVAFFRRLLNTVHACHTLGISHEDIKRSNVLCDDRYNPVLVDFGFSHFSPTGGFVRSAGGTLDYSSPEKVMVSYKLRRYDKADIVYRI